MVALRCVHAVAGRAADVPLIVLAAVPQRMRRAVVARRAGRAHVGRRHLLGVLDERHIAALGVCLARSVTAFTAVRGGRCTRVEGERVHRALVRPIVMAPQARFLAGVLAGGGRLFRRRTRGGRLGPRWTGSLGRLPRRGFDIGRGHRAGERTCQGRREQNKVRSCHDLDLLLATSYHTATVPATESHGTVRSPA